MSGQTKNPSDFLKALFTALLCAVLWPRVVAAVCCAVISQCTIVCTNRVCACLCLRLSL